jgi:hypothetical protein
MHVGKIHKEGDRSDMREEAENKGLGDSWDRCWRENSEFHSPATNRYGEPGGIFCRRQER